jgi:hypothetical protein
LAPFGCRNGPCCPNLPFLDFCEHGPSPHPVACISVAGWYVKCERLAGYGMADRGYCGMAEEAAIRCQVRRAVWIVGLSVPFSPVQCRGVHQTVLQVSHAFWLVMRQPPPPPPPRASLPAPILTIFSELMHGKALVRVQFFYWQLVLCLPTFHPISFRLCCCATPHGNLVEWLCCNDTPPT